MGILHHISFVGYLLNVCVTPTSRFLVGQQNHCLTFVLQSITWYQTAIMCQCHFERSILDLAVYQSTTVAQNKFAPSSDSSLKGSTITNKYSTSRLNSPTSTISNSGYGFTNNNSTAYTTYPMKHFLQAPPDIHKRMYSRRCQLAAICLKHSWIDSYFRALNAPLVMLL